MTTLQALDTHYRAVRDRLNPKPQKREWSTPQVVEIETPRTLRDLVSYIAAKHHLDPKALIETKGVWNPQIVQARRELYYSAYQLKSISTTQMAKMFKRDHSTIVKVAKLYADKHGLPLIARPHHPNWIDADTRIGKRKQKNKRAYDLRRDDPEYRVLRGPLLITPLYLLPITHLYLRSQSLTSTQNSGDDVQWNC